MDTGASAETTQTRQNPFDSLSGIIRDFGYSLPDRFGTDVFVATLASRFTPVMFRLEYAREKGELFLFPWVRTSSWQYDGERTDIHDIAAIAFAAAVTGILDMPASLVYDPGFVCDMEMYTVFVVVGQSQYGSYSMGRGYRSDDSGLSEIAKVFGCAFWSWQSVQKCEYDKHREGEHTYPSDTGFGWEDITPWATTIAKVLRTHNGLAHSTYSKRRCPSWAYFHDSSKHTVVIRSEHIVEHLRQMASVLPTRTLRGIKGRLIVTANRRTVVPFPAIRRALRLLRALGDSSNTSSVSVLCLDNRVLIGGKEHLVAINCESGRASFDKERERVRDRFEAEAEILFPATGFVWEVEIPDDAFEAMICELLELEGGVIRVRRAGVTRERDGGRDLVAEWIPPVIASDVGAYASELPREPVTVVVQCKVSAKTVGKGKVQDIRDTVEHHSAHGYFLAVSSQISGPLISSLECLKRHNWFVEWWTRLEIESRLRRHPDVADRYRSIVRRVDENSNPDC